MVARRRCALGSPLQLRALFAEVRVDVDIPIPRVRRVVGVYSAGKILNAKTARSQMTGGIIWGIGPALLERSETDPGLGRFLSKNLSGYLVPVNADVPEIDASLSRSTIRTPVRSAPSASGVRVSEVPIRPEHLLAVEP